jgi:hypothetical protein
LINTITCLLELIYFSYFLPLFISWTFSKSNFRIWKWLYVIRRHVNTHFINGTIEMQLLITDWTKCFLSIAKHLVDYHIIVVSPMSLFNRPIPWNVIAILKENKTSMVFKVFRATKCIKSKGLVYYSVTPTERASHFWLMRHFFAWISCTAQLLPLCPAQGGPFFLITSRLT